MANKTKIEWCDFSINPVRGLCPVDCKDTEGKSYCYARRIYQRFGWNPEIWYEASVWLNMPRKPSRIFVGSTMELFGPWVKEEWIREILYQCGRHLQHTFIFLTKRPWELPKYNPWPSNCWVGMSAPTQKEIGDLYLMADVQAKVRFVSFEPLLDYSAPDLRWIDWVIIGGMTGRKNLYPPDWQIREIESHAAMFNIPVFEKPNLRPQGTFRQEFPDGQRGKQ